MEPRDPLAEPSGPFLGPYKRSLTPALARDLHGWALLAISALAVAGVFALFLALSRTPGVGAAVPWLSGAFFGRGLVTHVVFSFQVWYLAALGALVTLVTAKTLSGAPEPPAAERLGRAGLWIAWASFVPLLLPALAGWGEASLNNYVPVIAHPVFYAGLGLLALGVALAVVRLFAVLARRRLEDPVTVMTAAAGLSLFAALACFAVAWARLEPGLPVEMANEAVFWGGGHVLQVTNTLILFVGWWMLSAIALDEQPLSTRLMVVVTALLALAALVGPVLEIIHAPGSFAHARAFTALMVYGMAAPPLVMMAGLAWSLWRCRGKLRWGLPSLLALVLSLALFAVGGLFGMFSGQGDTRTPAHYHAMIGGVNLALMGLYFVVFLPLLGRMPGVGRMARAPFWLYGWGQFLFSSGMFLAGALGVARKTAGEAQELDTLERVLSMALTGSGGVIAVVGGVLFVWMALVRLWPFGKVPDEDAALGKQDRNS